jgi:hypothetical protein
MMAGIQVVPNCSSAKNAPPYQRRCPTLKVCPIEKKNDPGPGEFDHCQNAKQTVRVSGNHRQPGASHALVLLEDLRWGVDNRALPERQRASNDDQCATDRQPARA